MRSACKYLFFILVCLSVGCARHKIIPEAKLQKITEEMFLANAYVGNNGMNLDSVDIYTPILKRYGYTQDDLFYTLASFQKRKSARFSDVIESTITSLEGLSDAYEERVRGLDYIDSLALAMCSKEVLFIPQIKVTRMRDTARLRLKIPIKDEGEYKVSFTYMVDSLDKNLRLQSTQEVYNAVGNRSFYFRSNLLRNERKQYTNTVKPKAGATEYRLQLADYANRDDRPSITVDSIRIVYFPPVEKAIMHMDSVMRFRPNILKTDSINVFGRLQVAPPLLPADTLQTDSLKTK